MSFPVDRDPQYERREADWSDHDESKANPPPLEDSVRRLVQDSHSALDANAVEVVVNVLCGTVEFLEREAGKGAVA